MLRIVPKLHKLLSIIPIGSGDLIVPQAYLIIAISNHYDVTARLLFPSGQVIWLSPKHT